MVMANKAISLASFTSAFPSFDKLNKSSKCVQRNSRVSSIPQGKAVQRSDESDTGRWAKQRRPQNVDGDFFVDHTCIDCDTCRWMAPQVFTRVGDMSAVYKQPACKEDRLQALQALLSCPTSSIRTEVPPPDILEAQESFPIPIDEKKLPGVYHCGYHSSKSYGASSYLIVHSDGNILIDSPRFTERLAHKIKAMGGVHYMFLTHKDDVADHGKWAKRFSCDRILHGGDVEPGTADVEMKLDGSGPWSLGRDIMLIHTPGHTKGSVCLFYSPLKILFTGDHLIMRESGLDIVEMYNRYSGKTYVTRTRVWVSDFGISIFVYTDISSASSLSMYMETFGGSYIRTHVSACVEYGYFKKNEWCIMVHLRFLLHDSLFFHLTRDHHVAEHVSRDCVFNSNLIHIFHHLTFYPCFLAVGTQVDSVRKLLDLDFNWIIPGHGRRIQFKDVREKNAAVEAFVEEKYAQYSWPKNK